MKFPLKDFVDENDHCPNCGITWNSEQTLPEDLFETGFYETIEAAEEAAGSYGWTKENDRRFKKNVIGIYDMYTDRTTHYSCLSCENEFPRFVREEN